MNLKIYEQAGEQYCRQNLLNEWHNDILERNWWKGLKFFFSRTFPRGRREELTNEYYSFALEVLKERYEIVERNCSNLFDLLDEAYERLIQDKKYFDKKQIRNFKRAKKIGNRSSLKHPDFREEIIEKNPIIKLLVEKKEIEIKWEERKYRKKIYLGNEMDIMLVLDTLSFISSSPQNKNIYLYFKQMIENNRCQEAYNELNKFYGVSDKLATFFIRDVLLLNPDMELKLEDYKIVFPIDTWVAKEAKKLGCDDKDIPAIKECLIKRCLEQQLYPPKVAAGLWKKGYRANKSCLS